MNVRVSRVLGRTREMTLVCGHVVRVEFPTDDAARCAAVPYAYNCPTCDKPASVFRVTSGSLKSHTYDCGIHPHSGEWFPQPLDNRCPVCSSESKPLVHDSDRIVTFDVDRTKQAISDFSKYRMLAPGLKRFAYVICELVDGDPSFRHTFVEAKDAEGAYFLGHDALKQPFRGFVNDYTFEVP